MPDSADTRTFVYRIDKENRICFVNEDWLDFARENGAPELTREAVLGQSIARFIDDWDTQNIYELIYQRVRDTGLPVVLPFRCDTPGKKRFMQLSLRLQERDKIEFAARVLSIKERRPVPLLERAVRRSHTMVTICSWCKRIKTKDDTYVEVEEALSTHGLFGAAVPQLTHGCCPDCFDRIRKELQS